MPHFDQSLIFLLSLHRPPGAGNDPVVEGNCVIVYEADGYGGEYTKPNAGQAKYEGWTKEGKARFKVLRKLNKDGRASANNNHLEQAILSQVRAHLNITASTPEELKRSLKRKRVVDDDDEGELDEDGEIFQDSDEE